MKNILTYTLLLFILMAKSQDKLYLQDGSCLLVKVLEIAPDKIKIVPLSESGAPFRDSEETISKKDVILIEFKSGLIEIYNIPNNTFVYNPNGSQGKSPVIKNNDIPLNNFGSVNVLALCNSDVSAFFEHLLTSKKIGLGLMAAYNFNKYAISPNAFIALLSSAKKNYDLGVFGNIYPGGFKKRTGISFGLMFKYTSFSFNSVTEEKIGTSVNIKYSPTKGSQLATIFTFGTHSKLTDSFFIKTIFGIGGFNLRGEYRTQLNYVLNKNRSVKDPEFNYKLLPKLYAGVNLGFNF